MRAFCAALALTACVLAVPASAGALNIVVEDEPRAAAPGFVRVHRNAGSPAEAEIARAVATSADADYLERFPRSEFMLVAHVAVSDAQDAEGEGAQKSRLLSISCGVARRSGTSPALAEGYRPEFMIAVIGGDFASDPSFTAKSVARVCRSAQRKAITLLHQ